MFAGKARDLFEISSDSGDEEMNAIVEKLVPNKSSTSFKRHQQQQFITMEQTSSKIRNCNSKHVLPSPTSMSTPIGKPEQQTPVNRSSSSSSTPVQRSIRRYGKIKKSVNPFSPVQKQVR